MNKFRKILLWAVLLLLAVLLVFGAGVAWRAYHRQDGA